MQLSRRINHTGRRKIGRSEVQLRLEERDSSTAFTATIRLDKEHLPTDANVFVEAYYRNTSQRFNFGTVGAPLVPPNTELTDIDRSGPVLFRVKIVNSTGRLLAVADRLRPMDEEDEGYRDSLMTLSQLDLQQLAWRIDFSDDRNPTLCINNRLPDALGQLQTNPVYQALILPGAFREVLMFVLWNLDGEPEEGTWEERWLRFAEHVAPSDRPDHTDPIELTSWVDDVVREFSRSHELCDLMLRHLEGTGA